MFLLSKNFNFFYTFKILFEGRRGREKGVSAQAPDSGFPPWLMNPTDFYILTTTLKQNFLIGKISENVESAVLIAFILLLVYRNF